MGILVAKRMPAIDALGLADHTYVECKGGGKAWGCFGRKKGGTDLRSGMGSTRRADAIAGADERAGIKCYAVNGVCHQAANRILLPARILVEGARGYRLSESVYGPYGRPRSGRCASPFNQHEHVTGDLPACMLAGMAQIEQEFRSDAGYLEGALRIYARHGAMHSEGLDRGALVELHIELFMHLVQRQLGSDAKAEGASKLPSIREDEERQRIGVEEDFFEGKLPTEDFVRQLRSVEADFQKRIASVLGPDDYAALLGTLPGDWL